MYLSVCVYVCVSVHHTVLPPCWQAIAMQAHIQTHPNMPSSWPQGQCSCLAHNSDWLEYQWRELNPKQLLTRDIKQSGESSRGDLMMPPGKHVLAHTVALFNTIASKQLITLSKRVEEGYTASPRSPARGNWKPKDEAPWQYCREWTYVTTLPWYCFFILFLAGFHLSTLTPTTTGTSAKPKLQILCNCCLIILNHILPMKFLSVKVRKHLNPHLFICFHLCHWMSSRSVNWPLTRLELKETEIRICSFIHYLQQQMFWKKHNFPNLDSINMLS